MQRRAYGSLLLAHHLVATSGPFAGIRLKPLDTKERVQMADQIKTGGTHHLSLTVTDLAFRDPDNIQIELTAPYLGS